VQFDRILRQRRIQERFPFPPEPRLPPRARKTFFQRLALTPSLPSHGQPTPSTASFCTNLRSTLPFLNPHPPPRKTLPSDRYGLPSKAFSPPKEEFPFFSLRPSKRFQTSPLSSLTFPPFLSAATFWFTGRLTLRAVFQSKLFPPLYGLAILGFSWGPANASFPWSPDRFFNFYLFGRGRMFFPKHSILPVELKFSSYLSFRREPPLVVDSSCTFLFLRLLSWSFFSLSTPTLFFL